MSLDTKSNENRLATADTRDGRTSTHDIHSEFVSAPISTDRHALAGITSAGSGTTLHAISVPAPLKRVGQGIASIPGNMAGNAANGISNWAHGVIGAPWEFIRTPFARAHQVASHFGHKDIGPMNLLLGITLTSGALIVGTAEGVLRGGFRLLTGKRAPGAPYPDSKW